MLIKYWEAKEAVKVWQVIHKLKAPFKSFQMYDFKVFFDPCRLNFMQHTKEGLTKVTNKRTVRSNKRSLKNWRLANFLSIVSWGGRINYPKVNSVLLALYYNFIPNTSNSTKQFVTEITNKCTDISVLRPLSMLGSKKWVAPI